MWYFVLMGNTELIFPHTYNKTNFNIQHSNMIPYYVTYDSYCSHNNMNYNIMGVHAHNWTLLNKLLSYLQLLCQYNSIQYFFRIYNYHSYCSHVINNMNYNIMVVYAHNWTILHKLLSYLQLSCQYNNIKYYFVRIYNYHDPYL